MADSQDILRDGRWKAPFFTIWAGQAISLIGSRVAMFALIWWLTAETGSATVLALATLFAMLPQIVLGPIAGVYVDRWNRRLTMIVADGAIASASLGLAYLFWSGEVRVWHVYAIMLLRELGGIFHWPAMTSSTSLMVPRQHLARVSGLNQAMFGALSIVGPALGALLLAAADMHHIMLMDVGTAALAILSLSVIAIPQPAGAESRVGRTSARGDLRAGFRYLLSLRGLVILTAMAMVFKIALTPAFSLLPLLVTDHFGGRAAQLATLESAYGLGAILGGLLLGVWGGFRRNIYTTLMGLSAIGLEMLLLGVLPPAFFGVAVGTLLVMGVAGALTDGPILATLQAVIAPEMQGRVFMLFGSLISLTSPIGLVIAGPLAEALGIQFWYLTGGALCVAMAGWAFFIPAVVQLEDRAQSRAMPVGAEESSPPVQPARTA